MRYSMRDDQSTLNAEASAWQPTVLFVGPVPPPVFGQAIGMQLLLDSPELQKNYRLVHVNTNNVGKSGIGRILSTVRSLVMYVGKVFAHKPKIVYLMISRSRLGSVRDCFVIPLASWCGARVVVHLRGGDLAAFYQGVGPTWRRFLRLVYRRVSLGIVLGDGLRSQFDHLLPPERVRVALNCWFAGNGSVPLRRLDRGSDELLRIMFLSNVLPSKGLDDALEGIAWAIRRGVKLKFRFAGEFLGHDGAIAKLPQYAHENVSARTLERRFETTVKTLGIESDIERLGTITGRRKWELLAESDILLLPIYNPTEGQPLAVIEAMRAGCAIISTRCGGLIDIVEDAVTGKVVPPKRPDEIGRAIKWFWDHSEEFERIGSHNVARAERLHSPERHIFQMLRVFEEACLSSAR